MGKVILLTAYRRPAFFQRVLDALAGCWGIAEYTVLVSVDTCAEQPELTAQCVELARDFKATRDVRIRVHDPKLGIDGNKLFAFPQAFKEADYCIHFEDDIIPAKDCLRFLEWGGERFRIDPAVLSVSAYRRNACSLTAIRNGTRSAGPTALTGGRGASRGGESEYGRIAGRR